MKIKPAALSPGGDFELAGAGEPSVPYAVEGSADLSVWQQLGMAENELGVLKYAEKQIGAFRFFRLRRID